MKIIPRVQKNQLNNSIHDNSLHHNTTLNLISLILFTQQTIASLMSICKSSMHPSFFYSFAPRLKVPVITNKNLEFHLIIVLVVEFLYISCTHGRPNPRHYLYITYPNYFLMNLFLNHSQLTFLFSFSHFNHLF